MSSQQDLYHYTLRQADNVMVLCQRLCQWCAHAPELELDIALTNVGLDLIGQARSLYQYAATLSEQKTSEDDLAFMRDEKDWLNFHLVEQPNGSFADTIARQYCFDVWHNFYLQQLINSKDETLAAVAAKSIKEAKYHLRLSSGWLKRLGDGTELSHQKMQDAINNIWPFTKELFENDELNQRLLEQGIGVDLTIVEKQWQERTAEDLTQATLSSPEQCSYYATGGRNGLHSEHMGYILAEMQILPRSMPGCQW